ncbi:MAG: protein GlmU [Dissulfuribacterales bacterium]
MDIKKSGIKEILLKKGVKIPNPDCVEIGYDINPDRISGNNVIIHTGSKIFGKETLILSGVVLGYESPVTIENCYIGPNVRLNGGFFKDSVFLKNAAFGSCAHVREGTILEEEASAAHAVGLKQTILFPYVTLGSQINFCDCLMAGGTDKKNHSEVGSSYIHFNFTPQQDKATPSLIGDVPYGVMLNQSPIFLGGQGGLVGPVRLTYGLTIAAGTIHRKDELRPNRLIVGGASKGGNVAYTPTKYFNIKRIFLNNITYIANLVALMHWYQHVRYLFVSDQFPQNLLDGLMQKLTLAINERIRRLDELLNKVSESPGLTNEKNIKEGDKKLLRQTDEFVHYWPEIFDMIQSQQMTIGDEQLRNQFQSAIQTAINASGKDYLKVIKGLAENDTKTGSSWLQGIVDQMVENAMGGLKK